MTLPSARSSGQRDLADDGKRNWDDQVKDVLNSNYPDWKNPSKTYMIPPDFSYKSRNPDVGEKTEKNFYYLLQEFGESRNEEMFVVHSYRFAELISEWDCGFAKTEREKSKKWLIGEHDFVIIHRQHGVVFLQVKAAKEKNNVFANAQVQIAKDQESLKIFAQRELRGRCKELVGKEVYSYPGFVVMPNCPKDHESVTTPSNGIFAQDCENVDAFSKWWDKNIRRNGNTSVDQLVFDSLVMRFVGLSHARPSLSHVIQKNYKMLEFKTREQLKILLQSSSKQWITGPAGSGKTWILIEKVKILAERIVNLTLNEKILVVCYNKPLSKWLERRFHPVLTDKPSVVEVKTFDSLLYAKTGHWTETDGQKENAVNTALRKVQRESTNQKYDHIFIDEGQDLYGEKWPELFEHLLKKPSDDADSEEHAKHLWVMYDTNQHLSLSQPQYLQHAQSIKGSLKLSKVMRNTETIFNQTKKYFMSIDPTATGVEIGHQVTGLQIKYDASLPNRKVSEEDGAMVIIEHIIELQEKNIQQKDICILVENVTVRDKVIHELNKREGIHCQNADEQNDYVIVESVRRFKGLESKVIILYNPRFYEGKSMPTQKIKELLYTAMSRCFCYLIVITSKAGRVALKSAKGLREESVRTELDMSSLHDGLDQAYSSASPTSEPR